jgi:hypothetical protein
MNFRVANLLEILFVVLRTAKFLQRFRIKCGFKVFVVCRRQTTKTEVMVKQLRLRRTALPQKPQETNALPMPR